MLPYAQPWPSTPSRSLHAATLLWATTTVAVVVVVVVAYVSDGGGGGGTLCTGLHLCGMA